MRRIIPYGIGLLLLACGSASSVDGDMETDRPSGKALFNMNCSLCHGRDGKLGLNGAKDLTISTLAKPEMIAIVKAGKGAMMPYKDILSEKEIEAVVEHIRTLKKK